MAEPWAEARRGTVMEVGRGQSMSIGTTANSVYAGGAIAPGSVHGTTRSEMEIFVRDAAGRESRHRLIDANIGFRIGHEVVLVWGSEVGEDTGPYLFVQNLTTGEAWSAERPVQVAHGGELLLHGLVSAVIGGLVTFVAANAISDRGTAKILAGVVAVISFFVGDLIFDKAYRTPRQKQARAGYFDLLVKKAAEHGGAIGYDRANPVRILPK